LKRALLLLFVIAAAIPSQAYSGEWVKLPVRWLETYQGGSSGTSIQHRDTLFDVVAAGQTDTTWSFSLGNARPFLSRTATVTTNSDTAAVAWLIFSPDSAGVTAPTVSSITVEIDGRAGAYGGNSVNAAWSQIDSVVSAGLSTRGIVSVPIRAIGSLSNPALTTFQYNREYATLAYPELRARITAATGVMSACKVFLRYWKE